jgi:integrase
MRPYAYNRVDKVWTENDEAAFMRCAPPHLRLALTLALWTGQRQGDLLRPPWSAYDGTRIRLQQFKTGARVIIKVGGPLKSLLDATPKRSPIILTTMEGKPWTSAGFRSSWFDAQVRAGVVGVTFNDLRGTAVTRLALAGCSEAEIVSISGHSLRDVRSILDAHYLHRDPALADSAVLKLEKRTNSPN